MAKEPVLTDLTSLTNETSVVNVINTNNDAVVDAFTNTLSRDGSTPNEMEADFDMNGFRILNHPDPLVDTDLATLGSIRDIQTAAEAAATAAAGSATSASVSAVNAANSAATATAEASDAATSASDAQDSADDAANSAAGAATQAGNAATSASAAAASAASIVGDAAAAAASAAAAAISETNAATSATSSATSASASATSATSASTQATNAATSATSSATSATSSATQATNAATSASSAATSATDAQNYALALSGTSTTSLLIATGAKTFTTQSGKQFIAGQFLQIASNANAANYMHGTVTSYSGTSLVMNITDIGGSGTLADWNISIGGTQGATGATGAPGATGASGALQIAAAGGTADAITADFTPDVTLTDMTVCAVVAASANATTTPTFAPDGLTAHTITKRGGSALVAGDISASGHVLLLEYNLANTRWELLNPAKIENTQVTGLGTMSTQAASAVAISGGTITGLGTPSGATDAATKGYVDTAILGLSNKAPCRLASTANLNGTYLAGVLTNAGALAALVVDGVTVVAGDRLLLKNQSTGLQNGIYTVTTVGSGAVAWVLTRSSDADATGELVEGNYTIIEEGTANTGTLWILTTTGTITIGTTAITWTQLIVTAVAASALTGTTLASNVVTSSITTVGTLVGGATGSGFTIALGSSTITGSVPVVNGGTGQTTYTNGQILIGNTSGNTLAKATITNGGGITATGGAGSITLGVSALQTAWVPAAAIRPSSAGGCAALALVASAANQPDISSLDFDATTQEYAQFSITFPKGWNASTVTAQFHWSHPSTSTNFGVVWNLQAVSIADNEAMGVAYGTAQQIADTGGTTDKHYISAATPAITIAGSPAAGTETVYFRVSRVTGDASDTMAVDARLQGVRVFYTITTLDDT